jgi:hypothetical protein
MDIGGSNGEHDANEETGYESHGFLPVPDWRDFPFSLRQIGDVRWPVLAVFVTTLKLARRDRMRSDFFLRKAAPAGDDVARDRHNCSFCGYVRQMRWLK